MSGWSASCASLSDIGWIALLRDWTATVRVVCVRCSMSGWTALWVRCSICMSGWTAICTHCSSACRMCTSGDCLRARRACMSGPIARKA